MTVVSVREYGDDPRSTLPVSQCPGDASKGKLCRLRQGDCIEPERISHCVCVVQKTHGEISAMLMWPLRQ